MRKLRLFFVIGLAMVGVSCGGGSQPTEAQRSALAQPLFETEHTVVERSGATDSSSDRKTESYNELRNAYFGDLHVHTKYSFDAYAFGTMATPDDAYRFAKGEPIKNPAGFDM